MSTKIFKQYLNMLITKDKPTFILKYLKDPAVLRLKDITYFCGMDYASKEIYQFKEKISRYDHSLSTAFLTWKVGHNKTETISALYHDISSPCFSHVIDYMNKDYATQTSTEEKTEELLTKDNYLQACLKEDGILLQDIVHFDKHSVVDLPRPKLCSDRLDGLILTSLFWTKKMDINIVKEVLNTLSLTKNEDGEKEICFTNEEIAKQIKKQSTIADEFCHSNEDNFMMEFLANIVKETIETKIITYDELYTLGEKELILKIKNSTPQIKEKWKKFTTIAKKDVPKITLLGIKKRTLEPLVYTKRLR